MNKEEFPNIKIETFISHLHRCKKLPVVCVIDHKLEGDTGFFVAKCGLVGTYTSGDSIRKRTPTCAHCLVGITKERP